MLCFFTETEAEESEGNEEEPQTKSIFPAIWSEEGKYLATVLGDALVQGLTKVSEERPPDPVEYLANFLKQYKNGEVLASNIPQEVQERLKTGRAVTPQMLERVLKSSGGRNQGQSEDEPPLYSEQLTSTEQKMVEDLDDQIPTEAQLDKESSELIKNLDSDDELDQISNLDEIDEPEEPEENISQGTRDDRGQSVLHFAAARPVTFYTELKLSQFCNSLLIFCCRVEQAQFWHFYKIPL